MSISVLIAGLLTGLLLGVLGSGGLIITVPALLYFVACRAEDRHRHEFGDCGGDGDNYGAQPLASR